MAGTSCCVVLLVAHLAGDAEGLDACGNRVEHLGCRFSKAGDRCLARHRVDSRLLRANALERREPRADVLLAGAALLQAIDADAATTMDEKQSLQTVVKQMPLTPPSVQFSIRKLGLIKGHKFLMWDWETASEKKCVEAVIDWSSITRLEAAEEAQRSYGGTYEQCCAALKTRLENPRNLEKWNPELAALAQQLDKVQRTIDQLRAKQRDLNQKKAEVEALMRKQEV